jgi:hypothetical protein
LFHADGQRQSGRERERDRERTTEIDRRTNMTRLIVAFRNIENAPKHGNIQKESTETRLCFHKCQTFIKPILTAGRSSKDIKHV